jgi:hypothetical protein
MLFSPSGGVLPLLCGVGTHCASAILAVGTYDRGVFMVNRVNLYVKLSCRSVFRSWVGCVEESPRRVASDFASTRDSGRWAV